MEVSLYLWLDLFFIGTFNLAPLVVYSWFPASSLFPSPGGTMVSACSCMTLWMDTRAIHPWNLKTHEAVKQLPCGTLQQCKCGLGCYREQPLNNHETCRSCIKSHNEAFSGGDSVFYLFCGLEYLARVIIAVLYHRFAQQTSTCSSSAPPIIEVHQVLFVWLKTVEKLNLWRFCFLDCIYPARVPGQMLLHPKL